MLVFELDVVGGFNEVVIGQYPAQRVVEDDVGVEVVFALVKDVGVEDVGVDVSVVILDDMTGGPHGSVDSKFLATYKER